MSINVEALPSINSTESQIDNNPSQPLRVNDRSERKLGIRKPSPLLAHDATSQTQLLNTYSALYQLAANDVSSVGDKFAAEHGLDWSILENNNLDGVCSKPFNWHELQYCLLVNQLQWLGRSSSMMDVYDSKIADIKSKYASVGDYILQSVFSSVVHRNQQGKLAAQPLLPSETRDRAPVFIYKPNDFPYFLQDGISHNVLWTDRSLNASIIEKALLEHCDGANCDTLYFVNPSHLQSIQINIEDTQLDTHNPLKRKHDQQEEDKQSPNRNNDNNDDSYGLDTKAGGMHPRNPYAKAAPNFGELAKLYPEFAQYVHVHNGGHASLNWNNPHSLIALTRVLLQHDFSLQFSMPVSNLCPPVPRSLNYIHWIADLLHIKQSNQLQSPIRGLDIGTGASCIFPLLGYASYRWQFVATDVDAESLKSARANIVNNNLQDTIEIRFVSDRSNIFHSVLKEGEQFDFSMCNPPFFSSLSETGHNAHRVCAGTESELVCEGGEEEFVRKMILQSAQYKHSVRWFSSMLGRKRSLKQLTALLHSQDIQAVRVVNTEFSQGKQARWGLAWTFDMGEREAALQQNGPKKQKTSQLSSDPTSNTEQSQLSSSPVSSFQTVPTPSLISKLMFQCSANSTPVTQRISEFVEIYGSINGCQCSISQKQPFSLQITLHHTSQHLQCVVQLDIMQGNTLSLILPKFQPASTNHTDNGSSSIADITTARKQLFTHFASALKKHLLIAT